MSLQDVNDNPPVFESMRYTATVSEVARVGTSVLQVSADDADSSANSLLHYSLSPVSPDSQDAQFFYINAETGAIFLLRFVTVCVFVEGRRVVCITPDSCMFFQQQSKKFA